MAIILDQSNRAFTEDWRDVFTKSFESKGGEVVTVVDYLSGADQGFLELTTEALKGNPDGLLILGSAIDAAMISQQVAKLKKDLPIFTSEWSFTRDLLTHGGRTVEGISLFHTYNEQSQTDRYLQFVEAFKQRFRSTPSFPAVHGYDAAKFVLAGLKQGARSGPELKQYLLNLGEFESLQSSFKLNEYGDVKRELYLTKVRNGSFVVVE
jgi:branched-chain amino acid transport system substrate-binding protein